ncbi:MAG: signal peptidase I [Alphaproteobacteria bacterium]|nr:signal peptidase I [Alphaproteobacteria bacterium]
MSSTLLKEKARKETVGFIIAGIIAIIIRTFFFQPFNIPSGSMYPTLMVGDFLFVSKYTYGYSNTAFPFHHKFYEGRVMSRNPKNGEVVVFNNIKDPENRDFIKRCVGVPGDKIQVKEGILHINGQAVTMEYVGMYTYINQYGQLDAVKKYKETMPNGTSYHVLMKYEFGKHPLDNTPEYTVPEGHFFMMGDNRHNSEDSRVMDAVGFVPVNTLIGRAEILFFSTEAKLFRHPDARFWQLWNLDVLAWIPGIRWDRFLNVIR